ncbi:hypothetical protein O6H91_23G022800 [Diphasiastrum complanatum]|uniref:Uncharacterized protein n=1 Tax=Diphasiastrum complanatum TaxID=34168 RepID=A0ACC2AAA0_DIPCM|nr:hypothetical protein O6H91_23G022800 [Diphasiastrum complanatum]
MAQEVCKQQERGFFGLGHGQNEHSSAHYESSKCCAIEDGCDRNETVAGFKNNSKPWGEEKVNEEVWEEKRHGVLRRSGRSAGSSSDEEEFRDKKEYHRYKEEGIKDKVKHRLPGHKNENCEAIRIEKVHAEKKHGGWFGKKDDCSESKSVTVEHFKEKKHGGSRC